MLYKVGDKLKYRKCTCGDDLREGHVYEVLAVMGDMFVFYDSSNIKRVRNFNNRCFEKVEMQDEYRNFGNSSRASIR